MVTLSCDSLMDKLNSEREVTEGRRHTGIVGATGFVGGAVMRAIVYRRASIPGFFCHRVFHRGAGLMEAVIITALHTGLRRGDAAAVSPELETMAKVIARYLDAWQT
jgi:hypothetical protein